MEVSVMLQYEQEAQLLPRDRARHRVSKNRAKCRKNVRQIAFDKTYRLHHVNDLQGHPRSLEMTRIDKPYDASLFGFTEAVKYYTKRGSKVFFDFLDASKAFDSFIEWSSG